MPPKNIVFEDFNVGDVFESPSTDPMTAEKIRAFAELTGDKNRLHIDEEYAKKTPFGQRIAHGLFGVSLAAGLMHDMGIVEETVMAFRGLEWTFKNPALIGDTLSFRMEVKSTKAVRTGGGLVVFASKISKQDGKTLQSGIWKLIIKGRDQ
ncbi:MAG: dehydratase [Elusimicrobia bacterium]|nr:MAG: dehydratase [Elusimicrobiota bacterium]